MADISELLGKTIDHVKKEDDYNLFFILTEGTTYRMHHIQDCCESVWLEEVIGDLDDLIGSSILVAEERSEKMESEDEFCSGTWTFYELATNKGHVTLRWCGTSNGYYGESVDFSRDDEYEFTW